MPKRANTVCHLRLCVNVWVLVWRSCEVQVDRQTSSYCWPVEGRLCGKDKCCRLWPMWALFICCCFFIPGSPVSPPSPSATIDLPPPTCREQENRRVSGSAHKNPTEVLSTRADRRDNVREEGESSDAEAPEQGWLVPFTPHVSAQYCILFV